MKEKRKTKFVSENDNKMEFGNMELIIYKNHPDNDIKIESTLNKNLGYFAGIEYKTLFNVSNVDGYLVVRSL